MAFKFYSSTYPIFYKLLRAKFKEFVDPNNHVIRYRKEDDRSVWNALDPKTGNPGLVEAFGLDYAYYWSEKKSRHRHNKEAYIYEPSEPFILAFKFMNYSLDDDWYESTAGIEDSEKQDMEANALYQKFLKGNDLQISEAIFFDSVEPTVKTQITNFSNIELTSKQIEEVHLKAILLNLIQDYYDCVNDEEYLEAFQYWHPSSVPNTFENGFDDFYSDNYFRKQTSIIPKKNWISIDDDIVSIGVSIKQTLNCYISFDAKIISDIGRFRPSKKAFAVAFKSIDRIINQAEQEGFYIANEPLKDFMNFEVFEKINSIGRYNLEKVQKFMPFNRIVEISKTVEFQFSLFEKKYLIRNILCVERSSVEIPN